MDRRALGATVGSVLLALSAALILPLATSLYYGEHAWVAFLTVQLVALFLGAVLLRWLRRGRRIDLQQMILGVTLAAVVACLVGAFPLWLCGATPRFTDAVFEAVSGLTTTAATVIRDVELQGRGVLLWRALMQWLGGLTMVVLALAVLPAVGVGGMGLLSTQRATSTPDRLTPRIRETAKLLCGVYLLLTLLDMVLLLFCGVHPHDALCHAFATVSTGGFSTRNQSIGAFQGLPVELVTMAFLVLSGVNFSLLLLAVRGQWRTVLRDEELRAYLVVIVVSALALAAVRAASTGAGMGSALRGGAFAAIATATTGGFRLEPRWLADGTPAGGLTQALCILLMLVGGCAGSAAGGFKVVRGLVLLKHARNELRRLLHPRAVYALRYNGHAVSADAQARVLGLFLLFLLVGVAGTLAMTLTGLGVLEAIGSVAATLSNTGLGAGALASGQGFAAVSLAGKWILIFCMLLGRLELFTLLILLAPDFWRRG